MIRFPPDFQLFQACDHAKPNKLANTENYQPVDIFLSLQIYHQILKTESWPKKKCPQSKEDKGENMTTGREDLELYVKLQQIDHEGSELNLETCIWRLNHHHKSNIIPLARSCL